MPDAWVFSGLPIQTAPLTLFPVSIPKAYSRYLFDGFSFPVFGNICYLECLFGNNGLKIKQKQRQHYQNNLP